jgi:hypothetical protein
VLQHYGLERFLYRLACTPHRDRFILKGALLMRIWEGGLHRPTRDLDLLGPAGMSLLDVEMVIRDCMEIAAPEDGIEFDLTSIQSGEIRLEAAYQGVRASFRAFLGKSVLHFQVDVGMGDSVVPTPIMIDYPVLLDMPAPRISSYTPYSTIAEKFEAMIVLGEANSRMKDYYDIDLLTRMVEFEGPVLVRSLASTFGRRRTPLPVEIPAGLAETFATLPDKQTQWNAFLRRQGLDHASRGLPDAVSRIRGFLMPAARAALAGEAFAMRWAAGGPWIDMT